MCAQRYEQFSILPNKSRKKPAKSPKSITNHSFLGSTKRDKKHLLPNCQDSELDSRLNTFALIAPMEMHGQQDFVGLTTRLLHLCRRLGYARRCKTPPMDVRFSLLRSRRGTITVSRCRVSGCQDYHLIIFRIDCIIDYQEAVVVMLADVHRDGRILRIVPLYVQLLLLIQLASIDRGSNACPPITQHRQCIHIDVVVNQRYGLLRLFYQTDNMCVCLISLYPTDKIISKLKYSTW